ncbi:activated Cdc42 kinase-like [Aricia agestis]|uniref:activated Cdc42 kinase-like n=1 Tax=Aricia agestis TaxID=91739 RepID=UPI001C2040DA|nr:activated Cdc42 kinase-like [Aricia agestis]
METKLNDQESLREFLEEAELMHYFELFRDILKVGKPSQLKYVALEDLAQIGLSKPEQRRYKKIYSKHYPNTYITRLKKLLHVHKKNEEIHSYRREIVVSNDEPELKLSKHIISIEDITINKELGMGQFGVVQQGTWSTGRQRIQVAIKCLGHERMTSNSTEFLKEAAVMHSVEHDNIVRLYGVVLHLDSLMLVTELAPLRSLLECLREVTLRSNFPVSTLCDFASQICNGMSYLEQKRLIHRDLAARNILVFSKNKVKISDFGLSRALGAGKDYYQTNYNVNLKLPVAWCAPECILYLRFTSASDVWAYGVCLWEMFTYGFQPWVAFSGQQILEAIDAPKYQRLERPECCPDTYYELMLECWAHNPADRPRFKDIASRLETMAPERVIAITDYKKPEGGRRQGFLEFKAGQIFTVVGKERFTKSAMWYGSIHGGSCGLFDPALTKPYLEHERFPSLSPNRGCLRASLMRSDSKRQTKRIDRSMISGPQPDVRHTGHVGLDGAYFGNVPLLESPLSPLSRPARPTTTYRVDDAEPLLPQSPSHVTGSTTPYPLLSPSRDNAGDTITQTETLKTKVLMKALKSVSEPTTSKSLFNKVKYATLGRSAKNDAAAAKPADEHEYHEISDTDTESIAAEIARSGSYPNSPGPNILSGDFELALLKQVNDMLSSINSEDNEVVKKEETKEDKKEEKREEKSHEKEEKKLEEAAAKASCSDDTCTMKPMSSHDLKTLDTACAMANELTSKSMNGMEAQSPGPASDRRFQFKRALSSLQNFAHHDNCKESYMRRPGRRNFSDEARSVPDIQATLTEESRRAYESLIEQPPPLMTLAVDAAMSQARMQHLRLYTPEPCQTTCQSQSKTLPRPATMPKPAPRPPNDFRSMPKPIMKTLKPRLPTPPSSDDDDEDSSLAVPNRSSKPQLVDRPRHVRRHPLRDTPDDSGLPPHVNIYQNTRPELEPTQIIPIDEFIANPFEVDVPLDSSNPFGPYVIRHDSLDEDDEPIFEEVELRKTSDRREHVSVEDLLEFADHKPTSQERGVESDEVRIMCKVLNNQVSPELCLEALKSCGWNIHSAIKLSRVKMAIFGKAEATDKQCLEILEQAAGDCAKAAALIIEGCE